MDTLIITLDSWGHKELREYLMSLKGILDVKIENDDLLAIYLRYDCNVITPKMIKNEILLFLDIMKFPSMFSFDKCFKEKTSIYTIIRDDLCCEWCFKEAIEDLFDIDGIEKVESNFNDDYLTKSYDKREKIIIRVNYNPALVSEDEMKRIESQLTI